MGPRRRRPGRPRSRSRGDALPQQLLALLGALAARLLSAAEELGEVGIALAVGVLGVGLEAEHVVEALLGEPDDVVVLVLGARHVTGLLRCHRLSPCRRCELLLRPSYPHSLPENGAGRAGGRAV